MNQIFKQILRLKFKHIVNRQKMQMPKVAVELQDEQILGCLMMAKSITVTEESI